MIRVCLIGPGHLASNPRLVKEADALYAAGFDVRVVAGTCHPLVEPLDQALLATRPWRAIRVQLGSSWERAPRVLRRRVSDRLVRTGWATRLSPVAWSESELVGRLARAAAAEPADLYIGHYLPGLYASAKAADRHRAAIGFDAEDDHVAELPSGPAYDIRRRARRHFEEKLVPRCRHLTASSPLISEAYEGRYGRRPVTVLNVFPLAAAPAAPAPTAHLDGAGPATLYWFSQTVGPGRGLEQVVAAMGRMSTPAVLHLRGIPAAGFRACLEQLADRSGAGGRLVWHPPAEPDEMVRLAARNDLGLALEGTEPPNRAVCLTNKVFTYLLAGLPVLLSDTPAQARLAKELGPGSQLVSPADPAALAAGIDRLLVDRHALLARRAVAWRLGRERFNWEVESKPFLDSVRRAVGATTLSTGTPLGDWANRVGQMPGRDRR